MKYIIDKSILTNLMKNGCKKYAINVMDKEWKREVYHEAVENSMGKSCKCGSGKAYDKCCLKYDLEHGKEYRTVENKLGISIPHIDKAPLYSHIKEGNLAEINKIEELSFHYNIGTSLLDKENDKDKYKELKYAGDTIIINFNRSNREHIKSMIERGVINSKDFQVGDDVNGKCFPAKKGIYFPAFSGK